MPSNDIKVMEENVGKSSFENLLGKEEITKIGKSLSREKISANELVFKKVAPKSYTFSVENKCFIERGGQNNLDNYAQVVVFVNKDTNEYMAFVLHNYDIDTIGLTYFQKLLASNIVNFDYVRNISVNTSSFFGRDDLNHIKRFVTLDNVVTFKALVSLKNNARTVKKQVTRNKRKDILDPMEIYASDYNYLKGQKDRKIS